MSEPLPLFAEDEQTADKQIVSVWGVQAHMASLREYAASDLRLFSGTDEERAAFVGGLTLASHVLRHLFSVTVATPVLPSGVLLRTDTEGEEIDIAARALEVIEDIALAAQERREPGEAAE